jgi:hypothetical protein
MSNPARINDADHLPWPDTQPEVKWLSDEAIARVFGQQAKTAPLAEDVAGGTTARKPGTRPADRQPA